MTTAVAPLEVTDSQLAQYAKLIYDRTGIYVSPHKKTLLSNRVRRRLRATGVSSYDDYFKRLRSRPAGDPEWDAFLQEITTHETYLFRDQSHWDWFRDEFLKQISAAARDGKRKKTLRIWSAACSTGDEAYTLATCIAERLPSPSQWEIEILGTDLGVGAVAAAEKAEFGKRAMHLVPDSLKRRFFVHDPNNETWSPKKQLREWAQFRPHNLLEPLNERPFDLVFLKNVLIYFDIESKQKAIGNIRKALAPDAYLVTSAAEGVSNMLNDLETLGGWLHRNSKHQNESSARVVLDKCESTIVNPRTNR